MRLALALAMLASGQEPDVVFRTAVSLVRIDAEVSDGPRQMEGLGKDDFLIFDGGPQPVVQVAADAEPLDLLLLLDVSTSMREAVAEVSRAMDRATRQFRPGDRIGLAVFTSQFRNVEPFSTDLARIPAAAAQISRERFDGGTDILRALDESAALFGTTPRQARRRGILMVSDGKAPHYYRDEQTLRRLWEADIVLHALLIRSKGKDSALQIDLPKMTAETGGDAIRADRPGEAFEQMMERVRRRYSILYALPAGTEGQLRRVRVELAPAARKRAPKAIVKARGGYVWTAAANEASAGSSSPRNATTLP